MISKLVRWWRKATVLRPPELPAPPPQKITITQAAAEGKGRLSTKRKLEGVIEQRDDTLYASLSD